MSDMPAEQFLLDQVPMKYRALLPGAMKAAYDAASLLAESEPILQTPSAKDNLGRIKSWAVDLALVKIIESGRWPVDYRWVSFQKPTGCYLEVRLSHSKLTISQVPDAKKQPRNVRFRENNRLSNQRFLDLPEFADEQKVNGLPSFLLIHGYQDLEFVHLGVPNKHHSMGYIYRTPNLMKLPYLVAQSADVPPPESTDLEATMSLKEDIEKWRKDNYDD